MMIERKCEVCGAPIILKRKNTPRKYCGECAEKIKIENMKKAQQAEKERARIRRETEKLKERDKLGAFLRELDTYNNERRKRGECPVSYGKYVAIREGLSDV